MTRGTSGVPRVATALLADLTRRCRGGRGIWASWVVPLAIYLLSRVMGMVILVGAAPRQVPDDWWQTYLGAAVTWDGNWYETIAERGYPDRLPTGADGEVVQNPLAFYPLYPMLCRVLMRLTGLDFQHVAPLLSVCLGAVAVVLLHRYLLEKVSPFVAGASVAALCCFVSAPILQVAYTESLALVLIVLTLQSLGRHRYHLVIVWVLALGLTRAAALPMGVVIAGHVFLRWRARRLEPFGARERAWALAALVSAGVATTSWPVAAGILAGEPDAYVRTMRSWSGYEVPWPGMVPSLLHARMPAAATMVIGCFALMLWVMWRRAAVVWGADLRLWSMAYLTYIVAATPFVSSVFRYLLLALVPLWPVHFPARAPGTAAGRTLRWVLLVVVVLVGFAAQFVWVRSTLASGTLFP